MHTTNPDRNNEPAPSIGQVWRTPDQFAYKIVDRDDEDDLWQIEYREGDYGRSREWCSEAMIGRAAGDRIALWRDRP